jgi:hypothetical protein
LALLERLQTATNQGWPEFQPDEARGAAGKLAAIRGHRLRLRASSQTTSEHDSNGSGIGPLV